MKATGKIIGGLVLAAMLLAVGTGFTQTTVTFQNSLTGITLAPGTPDQPAPPDSIVQMTAEAQGLQLVTPDQALFHSGSFCYWWVLPSGACVPMPCLPQDFSSVPVYQIVQNVFLVDETGGKVSVSTRHSGNPVTSAMIQHALETEATAVVSLIAQVQTTALNPPAIPATRTGGGMMMMASSLASSYAYANGAYLNNLVTTIAADGSTTMNFSIVGGTNFVPYDILMSTHMAAPVPSWNWLGIGYTSNRYTFAGQPADMGFYILAKPSKTMTVAWGNDAFDKADVPAGITNAVMVTGSVQHSLALLTDGTIIGWGNAYIYNQIPTNLPGAAMIAAEWNHSVVLLTNGAVRSFGYDFYGETDVPDGLTNVTVISSQGLHSLALTTNGVVVAWGDDSGYGETSVPAALTSVTAIAAGGWFNLAVSNGCVVPWGYNGNGQCNVPADLTNVWDVAAGWAHGMALKKDGTVVCWGDNGYGETNVPAGLSNVVAIAAGGYISPLSGFSMALTKGGELVVWGDNRVTAIPPGLTNVIGIGAGTSHALAIRTGPRTPVITLQPVDQYQAIGSSATFTAKGQGLYGVTYQWQTNGVNLAGATAATLTLTNVQLTQAGLYNAIITDNGGMGSLVSSNANLYLVTPPVITSQSQPTNIVCIYGNNVAFSVLATAPGQTNGFPLSYQWQFNGTNISAPNSNSYSFFADDNSSGNYSVTVANGAGSASASWQVTVTNTINVTNDLLLIYNTNSVDSATVLNYYLAHRPMVAGASVLGIGYPGFYTSNAPASGFFSGLTNVIDYETIVPTDFTNQILNSIQNWLGGNPTRRPQYVILFPDIPSRVVTNISLGTYEPSAPLPSVQYQIHVGCSTNWNPFVTSINMNGTNDCIGYINKLASIGTNFIVGSPLLSASAGGYDNTNWYFDGVNSPYGVPLAMDAFYAVLSNGVPMSAIDYVSLTNSIHITYGTNVVGYYTTGTDGGLGVNYYTNVNFQANSGWYIMETVDSLNGQRSEAVQGGVLQWFSANAFGGTNYSSTPIGAVCHVDEPYVYADKTAPYFGLWAAGKCFAICAWNSCNTLEFQAVGDPFVVK